MHRSRVLVAGSWLASTAVATLVSAAGVSIVTRDVTDDHRRALAAADVVALLHSSPTVPPDARPDADRATPIVSTADPPAAVDTSSPPTPPAPVAEPAPTPAGPAPAPTSDRIDAARPAATTDPATPTGTAAFATDGGVVAVACHAGVAALGSAWPNDGFRVLVHDQGPRAVSVEFTGAHTTDRLVAGCGDHEPVLLDRPSPDTGRDDHAPRADADRRAERDRRHDRDRDDRDRPRDRTDRTDRDDRRASRGHSGRRGRG